MCVSCATCKLHKCFFFQKGNWKIPQQQGKPNDDLCENK
jgi:hypothetical protein